MGVFNDRIRGLTVVIIKNKGRVLVSPGYDPKKDHHFYRLIGGGIEFGEKSLDALHRELKEELDTQIINPKLLGTLENVFTFNGQPGHEIAFLYEAEFKDSSLYDLEEMKILDSEDDGRVIWLEINEENNKVIYPTGVADYL